MIWGLRGGGNAEQRDMERRARVLLNQLDEDKASVIIPSVAVAELLVPIDEADHATFLSELQRRFICPPFDLRAASIAAQLWRSHRQLPKSDQVKRTTLKADVLIVATARAAGAARFYSHDKKTRRLAALVGIEGFDLPTHDENMFREQEAREASRGAKHGRKAKR
jgi:predicted nucleic acid-binding protein